jgi:hypothetical protein
MFKQRMGNEVVKTEVCISVFFSARICRTGIRAEARIIGKIDINAHVGVKKSESESH